MDLDLLRIVFDHVYNGIYIADGRGVTIAVNRTFEEMSGICAAELVGRNLHDLVGRDNYFTGSATLIVLERRTPATVTYSTRAGRKLLVKGKPVFGAEGEILYVINTVWDLTVVAYNREIDSDTAREHLLAEEDLIACSDSMRHVLDLALKVAVTDSTILLTGETGVGKSLIAKLIHRSSERCQGALMQINCAALPAPLLESELFGYEPGSFTGADRKGKPGLFELADGGTIFLDEISELPLHLQSKLLGFLQDRSFFKVGGRSAHTVNVRLIAATNRDLPQAIAAGLFREDLFYRLNVVPLTIPPLRERREDIPVLIAYFLERCNRRHNRYKVFSPKLIRRLVALPWKGNIRELENTVERIVVTSDSEDVVPAEMADAVTAPPDSRRPLRDALWAHERNLLCEALRHHHTTRGVAAALGISQASAARKIRRFRAEESARKFSF